MSNRILLFKCYIVVPLSSWRILGCFHMIFSGKKREWNFYIRKCLSVYGEQICSTWSMVPDWSRLRFNTVASQVELMMPWESQERLPLLPSLSTLATGQGGRSMGWTETIWLLPYPPPRNLECCFGIWSPTSNKWNRDFIFFFSVFSTRNVGWRRSVSC